MRFCIRQIGELIYQLKKGQQSEARAAPATEGSRHSRGPATRTPGREHFKSLLPNKPQYKNIQDAFQAKKGNSVNSSISFLQ